MRLVNDSGTKIQSLALIAENSTSYVSNSTGITAYQVFDDTNETKFKALQYSLFTTSFVEVIGGLFFLITAAYILRDKAKAEKAVSGKFFSRKLTNYVILVAFAAHMFHFLWLRMACMLLNIFIRLLILRTSIWIKTCFVLTSQRRWCRSNSPNGTSFKV